MPETPLTSAGRTPTSDLLSRLDHDRSWLESQPSMRPWPSAKARLVKQLEAWVIDYGATLLSSPLRITDADHFDALAIKLWECWKFHWRGECDATEGGKVDGMKVATRIQAGQGIRSGSLGGDVLHDVVWADGVLRGDERATRLFIEEFTAHAIAVAKRVSPRFADKLDWWEDIQASLVVREGRPGKLANFKGESGLKPWLGRVFTREIMHFAEREVKQEGAAGVAEPLPSVEDTKIDSPDEALIRYECQDRVRQALAASLETLDASQRQALMMHYVDQLDNKQAAQIMGVAEGSATRRRQSGLANLRELLLDQVTQGGESLKTCLNHILGLDDDNDLGGPFDDGNPSPKNPAPPAPKTTGSNHRGARRRGESS
ncbi:MAG: sigma-70 family RNA polymerase sigma factor [Pirellulales bacterium]